MYVPTKVFFTKGVGTLENSVVRRPCATRRSEIGRCRSRASSAALQGRHARQGQLHAPPGAIVHCVLAEQATNEPNRSVPPRSALRPSNKAQYGYL
jgi:arginine decarboxylase